jgi:ketosteroid isomerase-like protein
MSTTTDRAEIEALFQELARAQSTMTRNAIVEAYAPDAVILDLAPPLGRRGLNRDDVTAWFAGRDGPIQIDARDVNLIVGGNLAFVPALTRMRGRKAMRIRIYGTVISAALTRRAGGDRARRGARPPAC